MIDTNTLAANPCLHLLKYLKYILKKSNNTLNQKMHIKLRFSLKKENNFLCENVVRVANIQHLKMEHNVKDEFEKKPRRRENNESSSMTI